MSPDVIVVGAGPAGAFSAFHAARLGADVEIYEEHAASGSPPHCTGHVSLTGLRHLGLDLPRQLFENQIRCANFYSPSNHQFPVRFPSSVTCVINRPRFDEYLREKAIDTGVHIVYNSRVSSLVVRKHSIAGITAKSQKGLVDARSKVVINAEGVFSTLLKRAGLPSLNRHMTVNGVEADVDRVQNIELDSVEVFLSNEFAPGLFAWIVPRSDGSGKVGLGTMHGNPVDHLHRFVQHNPVAREKLMGSRLTQVVCHPITLGGPLSKTFHNGLLIVGDAASHVKPTTGGGLIMGLIGAQFAGKVAASVTEGTRDLSQYERLWKKEFGLDMMIMRQLRFLLSELTDKKLNRLMRIAHQVGLHETLGKMIHVDFQGKSLLHAVTDLKTLAIGLYLSMRTLF